MLGSQVEVFAEIDPALERCVVGHEGLLLGGLGISGGSVEQDMDIAETAIAAINVRTHQ